MAELNDRGFFKSSKIGDVGELAYMDVLEIYKKEGKITSYLDLRKNRVAQILDCDYVIFTKCKDGDKEYDEQDAEELLLSKSKRPSFCKFVEIKTDTRILDTRNIYLEWIAHDVPGCFGISRADKWIYYGVDVFGVPKKVWSIDFRKMRGLLTNGQINTISKREYSDAKVGNYAYVVCIDDLIKLGVAKELQLDNPGTEFALDDSKDKK